MSPTVHVKLYTEAKTLGRGPETWDVMHFGKHWRALEIQSFPLCDWNVKAEMFGFKEGSLLQSFLVFFKGLFRTKVEINPAKIYLNVALNSKQHRGDWRCRAWQSAIYLQGDVKLWILCLLRREYCTFVCWLTPLFDDGSQRPSHIRACINHILAALTRNISQFECWDEMCLFLCAAQI